MSRLSESEFVRGYVYAMLELSCGPDAEPDMRDGTMADLADETVDRIHADCRNFQGKAAAALAEAYERGYSEQQAGIDFWLTRNGHGAGFWDREQLRGELGERLSAMCRHSDIDLYRGDDGKLYFGG